MEREAGRLVSKPSSQQQSLEMSFHTLLHLYTLPQPYFCPMLHLRTDGDGVSDGRGIHRLQTSSEKIPKQRLEETVKVVSAWEFATCHTLPW